jgi:putative transcriptional regulator
MSKLRRGQVLAAVLFLPAALFASPSVLPLLVDNPEPPAPGKFLVAAQGLGDPNFRQAVVLLIDHDEDGSWGLVINRPTPLRLRDLLPEEKMFRGREDTLLAGGPVAPTQLLALFRSARPLRDSRPVFDDVHLTWSRETLRRLGTARQGSLRLYAGYAGWGPGQLEVEITRGDWHVMSADAEVIFSEHLEGVWELLVRRAPVQVAVCRPRLVDSPKPAAAVYTVYPLWQRRAAKTGYTVYTAGYTGDRTKNPGTFRHRGEHAIFGVCRHPDPRAALGPVAQTPEALSGLCSLPSALCRWPRSP